MLVFGGEKENSFCFHELVQDTPMRQHVKPQMGPGHKQLSRVSSREADVGWQDHTQQGESWSGSAQGSNH